jgi:hypothetical protein
MTRPRPFLLTVHAGEQDGRSIPEGREPLEVTAAIELVAAGLARRVVLSGLPDGELLAAEALAAAQAAGVAFVLSRDPGSGGVALVFGPREA